MSSGGFGGVIKLGGEKEYKAALQQIRQSLRETGSSLTAISTSFKTSSQSMDAMKSTTAKLTEVLRKQSNDYDKLKTTYEKMNGIYKTNGEALDRINKRYQDAKAKLATLEETVGKTSEEYKSQAKVVAILEQTLEKETKKQNENEVALSRMRVELNNSETAFRKTAQEVENLEKAMAESEDATKKASSAYGSLQSTIENQETKLKSLKTEYKNIVIEQGENSQSARNLASQISSLSGELNDNKSKLNNAEKAADNLTQSMNEVGDSAKGASGGFSVFKGALANLVSNTIQNAIGKLKELASTTIEAGMKFDSAMSKVQAISGATGKELSQLRDKAKEMGSTTKFTATESAEAFNYMAMAGWKTEDMLNGIDGVLNLAAASGSDLATTSDIVTDALTAMGYSAKDAGRLADVMAAASANANTNVEMMGQTFQYAAPIAGALKYSMEDTAVAIGLMANAGIKGEKAGTALRSTLTRLSAPPAECKKAMDALGISIKNTDGTMKPLNEVIGDLRKSFDGLSEAEQTQYAKNLAGQEAMSGLLAIVNAAPADYDKLTKAVENSSGAAKDMADTMLDNTEGGFTLLKSNIEGVQIAIYEKFEPALRKGIEVLNKLTNAVRFVVDHSGEFTAALAAMTAGIGAYVAYNTAIKVMTHGWKSLAIVQKAVTAAQWLMNAAMAANPIGLAVAGIAALTVGFVVLWKKSEGFRNFWIGLWETIKSVAQPIIESLSGWFSTAWEKIKEIWAPVAEFFSNLFSSIVETVKPIIESIGNAFKEAWELIKVVWDLVAPYFQTIWDNIKIIFGVGQEVLSGAFKVAWEVIKAVWAVVVPYFKTVWNNIKAIFSVVKDVLGGAFELAWTSIKAIWNTATSFFKSIWDSIAGIFKVVKSVLTGNWRDAWEGIKGIVNTWVGFFKGVWDNIKNVFSGVINFFKKTFSSAWTAVKNVFSGWGKFFGGLWDTIKEKFSSIGTSIANAIGGAVKKGINGVISMIENTINSAIGLINGAINLINKIPGLSIGKIKKLSLPKLAKGGVLDKGARTDIAGEDGTEAIIPLEKNTKWIKMIAAQLQDQMFSSSLNNTGTLSDMQVQTEYNVLIDSFEKALAKMKIELDDETVGKFVENTVSTSIYS